jgi:hypothetical protein
LPTLPGIGDNCTPGNVRPLEVCFANIKNAGKRIDTFIISAVVMAGHSIFSTSIFNDIDQKVEPMISNISILIHRIIGISFIPILQ